MMSAHPRVTAVILVTALTTLASPQDVDAQAPQRLQVVGHSPCDLSPCGQYVSGQTVMWVLVGGAAPGVTWWLIKRSKSEPKEQPSASVAVDIGSVHWRALPEWIQKSVDKNLLELSVPNGPAPSDMIHRPALWNMGHPPRPH